MPTTVDLFIDYVCPFCLLVEPALKELERERDVAVRIHPYELRPHPVPTLRPEDDYLPHVWREVVYPMAERLGITIALPTISPQPRTERAFLGLQIAQEAGAAAAYSEAMLRAFFQEDRDIGSTEVTLDVAASTGLDRSAVEAALVSRERRRQHRADLAYAVERVGITSVPGVVITGAILPGVPTLEQLKAAVDAPAARVSEPAS